MKLRKIRTVPRKRTIPSETLYYDEEIALGMLRQARINNNYDEIVMYCYPILLWYCKVNLPSPKIDLEDLNSHATIFLIWALQRYNPDKYTVPVKLLTCIYNYLGFALKSYKQQEAKHFYNTYQLYIPEDTDVEGFDDVEPL